MRFQIRSAGNSPRGARLCLSLPESPDLRRKLAPCKHTSNARGEPSQGVSSIPTSSQHEVPQAGTQVWGSLRTCYQHSASCRARSGGTMRQFKGRAMGSDCLLDCIASFVSCQSALRSLQGFGVLVCWAAVLVGLGNVKRAQCQEYLSMAGNVWMLQAFLAKLPCLSKPPRLLYSYQAHMLLSPMQSMPRKDILRLTPGWKASSFETSSLACAWT